MTAFSNASYIAPTVKRLFQDEVIDAFDVERHEIFFPHRHQRSLQPTNPGRTGSRGLVMAATIGEQLRLAREQRGIPLREISDETRISVRYLEAIEANDYKRLPGGIFNRSFVRAYARCVGYDEKEAVEAYARHMRDQGEPGDDVVTTPHHSKVYTDAPATRSPLLTVVLAILILAILTLGALAALHWFQRPSARVNHSPSVAIAVMWSKSELQEVDLDFGKTDYERALQ